MLAHAQIGVQENAKYVKDYLRRISVRTRILSVLELGRYGSLKEVLLKLPEKELEKFSDGPLITPRSHGRLYATALNPIP